MTGDDDPPAADEPGPRAGRLGTIGPGDELGRYLVGDELGAGGMATVFRARDRELRRDVALKILFPHLARKAEVTRRFQREARAAAGLEHPNILRVYDVGGATADTPPYIVMELVRGGTLRELAETGPRLPAETVACVGALVCRALAAAHAAGIVHRDVKPGNLMLADDGRLLLADFGVAHLEDDDSLVTRTGALLGTPSFMAPEQALGQAVDARSDLYGVGATLYQLATGAMPYSGSTAKIVTEAGKGSALPAAQRVPALGSELSRLIARLMAPTPAGRPASAVEAERALTALAAAGGLDDPEAELRALVADRAGYVAARQPALVERLLARAEDARARRALPLAMALADRALAMAPAEPRAQALVERLAAGGGRRRTWLVVGGGAAVVALAAAGWLGLRGGGGRAVAANDAGLDGGAVDVAVVASDATEAAPDAAPAEVVDAAVPAVLVDAAAPAVLVDAGRRPLDAGPRLTADAAAFASPPIDASSPPSDAPAPPPVDAAPVDAAPVAVTFAFDTWCDLSVDGVARGRAERSLTVALAPGRHAATCSQGRGLGSWSQPLDVVAGPAVTVRGSLLPPVEVVVAVGDAVRLDGVAVVRGRSRALRPGVHLVEIVVAGKVTRAASLSFPSVARCTLRDQPTLDCYP